MDKEKILKKLKAEFRTLKSISEKQFQQRFTTSKYEDKWQDEVFQQYHESRIKIDLLLELLE